MVDTTHILDTPCELQVVPDDQCHVRIRGLKKSFGSKTVLRGVDLDVKHGETVVILGLSGSGKTTVLKHLMGVHPIEEGSIRVGRFDLGKLDAKGWSDYRRELGVVFQHAALLNSMTVEENIALPLIERHGMTPAKARPKVLETLRQVFLPAQEVLHLKPASLSGGMKKRVGLARAIVEGAPLILFDEPTTGLDPVTVSGVNELIREMQRRLKITSIVITHDLDSAAKIGDRIAMLYRGRIVACGTMDQLHASTHPAVRPLLTGATRGPLTDDYINRGIVPTE